MTSMIRMTSTAKALAVFFAGLAVAAAVTLVSAHPSTRAAARTAGELPGEAQAADRSSAPMRVAIVVFAPSQGSSPRIIHIPQGGERDSQANAGARDEAVADIDDANVAPAPRYRVIPLPRHSETPAVKRHAKASAPQPHKDVASIPPHGDAPVLRKLNVAPKQQSNAQPAPRQDDAGPAAPPQADAPAVPQRRTDVPPPQLGMNPPAAPAVNEADAKLTPVRPTPNYGNKTEQDRTAPYGRSVSAHIPPPPPPIGYTPPSGLSYRSN